VKLALMCLLMGVLPAAGETRWAPSSSITLYRSFEREAPASVVEAMQQEVEAIMEPIGLHFEWRDLSTVNGHEVSAELAVVTFKGRCGIAPVNIQSKFTGALGWTHVSDGEILPFTDIACDRIREFVQRSLLGVNSEERDALYGRALGRVLAHELYHIFANTTRHASWGVAKECYTVNDLLTDDFQFREKESRLLRANRPTIVGDHRIGNSLVRNGL
jgi:hypothetical protein